MSLSDSMAFVRLLHDQKRGVEGAQTEAEGQSHGRPRGDATHQRRNLEAEGQITAPCLALPDQPLEATNNSNIIGPRGYHQSKTSGMSSSQITAKPSPATIFHHILSLFHSTFGTNSACIDHKGSIQVCEGRTNSPDTGTLTKNHTSKRARLQVEPSKGYGFFESFVMTRMFKRRIAPPPFDESLGELYLM